VAELMAKHRMGAGGDTSPAPKAQRPGRAAAEAAEAQGGRGAAPRGDLSRRSGRAVGVEGERAAQG